MTINNFDQRVSRSFTVPASRIAYIRELEEKAKQLRKSRPKKIAEPTT